MENTFLTGYYNKARLAACDFLNNKLGCGIRIENVMLPVKRLTAKNDRACRPTDLCCRMTSDYPVRSAAEISTAEKTDAVFDFGNDGDTIFQGFYFDKGYANFLVSDEFILDAAKEFQNHFPIGRVCNNIALPDSREYVHARLICYRKANSTKTCSCLATHICRSPCRAASGCGLVPMPSRLPTTCSTSLPPGA